MIGDGSVFPWNLTTVISGNAPYPGVMVSIDMYEQQPADASEITMECNYFDGECLNWAYAVVNKDLRT